jgi:hypothetical protein
LIRLQSCGGASSLGAINAKEVYVALDWLDAAQAFDRSGTGASAPER